MSADGASRPRERVVLAQRRGARIVRTRVEVQEQTEVGDAMIRGLIRAQLAVAMRTAVVVVVLLCLFPVLMAVLPEVGELTVAGVRLPWLVLGIVVYPVLLGAGWLFVRVADRNEREFTDLVED
ncbi:membrane protein [Rhodococcoides trifolii]|uniref:Membrane protein n=1 Tax=Rhodococcoides trifolii TaxID=908250 RepID=A0A917G4A1_9NOCA|nr:hypothetical protein [Rhodococcus trifolii]GGG21989.1 membrane protein [Rhodococcus trifolii]